MYFSVVVSLDMGRGIEMASGGSDGVEVEDGWSRGRAHEGGTYLVWEDLTVVLPNFGKAPTKRLLQGLTGYAEPGRIMAIMGPSGSGKSTLLDSLAGLELFPFPFGCQERFFLGFIFKWNGISLYPTSQQIVWVRSQGHLFWPFWKIQ